MATLTPDALPRFGQGYAAANAATLTAVTPAAGGDEFANTGRDIVMALGVSGWTNETVQIEGVPSQDSARDGTATLNPGAVGGLDAAGPFKPRNWNTGAGNVQLTYPAGVTGLEVYVLRFTTG